MYTKDHVATLSSAIGALKTEPAIELGEVHSFGLGLDLFDPVSGQIITVARPQRADIGQSEILLTPAQVAQAVTGARINRLHQVRMLGFPSIDAAVEADKRAAAVADLNAKHDADLAELKAKQADEAAQAAQAAAPKKSEADKEVAIARDSGGKQIEGETPEQKEAREEQEERDRLAADQVKRHAATGQGRQSRAQTGL